jgi:predicted metal-dependent enzyme (double-stranded beta helix superfamily)
MAIAYLGPAADLDQVSSPNRSEGLQAGPGAPLPPPRGPRRRVDLLAIAEGFAVSAPAIPELQGLTERTWVLLAVTDLFEAWAIGWPAGGTIELHDHGQSRGVVVVASGELVETTVRTSPKGVALIGNHRIPAGGHRTFGPRYIHDLSNDGDGQAVSVHVYGPRLSTMSYYELDERSQLTVVRTEEVEPLGPFDTTSTHDPS